MKIYEGSEKFIFVSYAHADSDRVMPILEALDREGFRLWYDSGIEVGSEHPIDISEHIKACHRVIFFVSKSAIESKNCRNEVNFALSRNKEILVSYLESVELKYGLDLQLATNQAIFKSKFPSDDAFVNAILRAEIISQCKVTKAVGAEVSAEDSEVDPRELCNKGIELFNVKSYDQAFAYFKKSAAMDHAHAQSWMAFCYESGLGAEKDKVKAAFYYLQAAEQGHAYSQNRVGFYYRQGTAFVKNDNKSAYWFQKSAELGNADAQYNLAIQYRDGLGTKQDYAKAFEWFQKAADQGNHDAQCTLGTCYYNGQGTEQNFEKAALWYQKAADKGNAYAQYNLGICCAQGLGVEKNIQTAEYWYKKSAAQGLAAAKKALESLQTNNT